MRSVSGDIRFVRSYPLASLGHVQNFERTLPDKYVRWMNITHALVCGLSGSRAVCPILIVSASCHYPGQVREFPGRVPHAHSVIVQLTFCPLIILYIFVLSVIHLLHVR